MFQKRDHASSTRQVSKSRNNDCSNFMTITEKTETDWSTDNNNNCMGESDSDYDVKSNASRNTFSINVHKIEMT